MLIRTLTKLTNLYIFPKAQRELKGMKKNWIQFLRRFDSYYLVQYQSYEQENENPKLVQIHLEATNGCNIKCITCNNSLARARRGNLPLESACKIIDESWEELGAEGILGLYIRGESVLHPNLADIIQYAYAKGFRKILLSTNLVLLTEDISRRILESGITELRLSVDAVDAETFEKTRAGAHFHLISKNLEDLYKVKQEINSKCMFRLHGSLHRKSFEKIPQFIRKWNFMIDRFKFTVAVNQGGLFDTDLARSFSDFEFAVSENWKIPCRILYNYIGVTWNGKLTSCCVDYQEKFVVGSLEDGIKNGFLNSKSKALRQSHVEGNFGTLCTKCGFNNLLIDWFEDEVNELVEDEMHRLMTPDYDEKFVKEINKKINRFERLAKKSTKSRNNFEVKI